MTEDGTWRVEGAPLRIEVKVLVGGEPGSRGAGRRISKAAFAQIRATDLLDPQTSEPLGAPLARIHLPSEDCDEKPVEDKHIHILWQLGSELRFCCVPRDPWGDERTNRYYRRTLDDDLLLELQDLGWRSLALEQASSDLQSLRQWRGEAARESCQEASGHTRDEEQIYGYVEDLPPIRRLAYEEERFREQCEADGPYHGFGLEHDSKPEEVQTASTALEEEINRLESDRDEFRQNWHEAFRSLAALEQVYVGL